MIELHLALLAASAAVAFVAVLLAPTKPIRSGRILVFGLAPYVFLGVYSMTLVSTAGVSTTEWIVPSLCACVVILFCRSKRIAICGYVAILAITIGLFANFFEVVQNGYTANPELTVRLGVIRQRNLVSQAVTQLESISPNEGVLAPGQVSQILLNESFNHVVIVHTQKEWHSPVTRLFRFVCDFGMLWTDGGLPKEAARHVKVLPRITE